MIGIKTRMALFFAVVLGIVWLCVFAVNYQPPEPRGRFRQSFDGKVAGKVRMWDRKTGLDSFRLDACRIEKLRMGAFALSAFNVLCLDGLVLNLPLEEGDSEMQNRGRDVPVASKEEGNVHALTRRGRRVHDAGEVLQHDAGEAFARVLPQSFFESVGVSDRNFAGIEIKGLQVNKVEDRRVMPVFAADEAKNQGRTLKLKNCRVFNEGRTNLVGLAFVLLQPAPLLAWKGGTRKLDDLFPNLRDNSKTVDATSPSRRKRREPSLL